MAGLTVWFWPWRPLQASIAAQLKAMRVAFVGAADAPLTAQLQAAYAEEFAGAELILLDPVDKGVPVATVAGLDLVIAPAGTTASNAPLAAALAASPARKLLLPLAPPGWEWIGIDKQELAGTVGF